MNSIIECKDIVQIKDDVKILKNVSCKIPYNSIYAIMGPSGSGKTTLLRLFNRLDVPYSGNIFFEERNIEEYNVRELRKQVGMVFQIPPLFEGTVEDNLLFAIELSGRDVSCEELIKMVGLSVDILKKDTSKLSVGQSQRVAIARSLAMDLKVLLMDEPTSSLDYTATLGIEELIKKINKERNITIVIVSHNIDQVKRIATDVLFMVEGEKVLEGRVDEVLNSKDNKKMSLFLEGRLV